MTEQDTFNKLRRPPFSTIYANYVDWLNDKYSFDGLTLSEWLEKNNWNYLEFCNVCSRSDNYGSYD